MNRYYFISIAIILFSSCYSVKLSRFSSPNTNGSWILAFKDQIFIGCLYNSYPLEAKDSIFKMISKFDLYNPSEDFVSYKIENKKFIDSLSSSIPKNISPFWHIENPENKSKNVYMCTCLHYYTSRVLDSIAKREYKKYMKEQSKTGFDK